MNGLCRQRSLWAGRRGRELRLAAAPGSFIRPSHNLGLNSILEHPPQTHVRKKLEPGSSLPNFGQPTARCLDSAWVDCRVFLDRSLAFDQETGKPVKVPLEL